MASNNSSNDFDEAGFRDELTARGIPAHDAAETAKKMAAARRAAINSNAYRIQLIGAGMAPDQAKVTADNAAPFMGAAEAPKDTAAAPKKKKEAPTKPGSGEQ